MPDMVINKEIIESKLARLKIDKSPGVSSVTRGHELRLQKN